MYINFILSPQYSSFLCKICFKEEKLRQKELARQEKKDKEREKKEEREKAKEEKKKEKAEKKVAARQGMKANSVQGAVCLEDFRCVTTYLFKRIFKQFRFLGQSLRSLSIPLNSIKTNALYFFCRASEDDPIPVFLSRTIKFIELEVD